MKGKVMARNLGVLVPQLLPNSNCIKNHILETLILAPSSQPKPFSNCFHSPNPRFLRSGSGRSRICSLNSDVPFCQVMFELEDDLLESPTSVIFFFSAPSAFCALVSPVLQDLIERFPHEDSDYAIWTFDVCAVPVVAFIKDREWVSNCVGANVAQLKYTFEALYGDSLFSVPDETKEDLEDATTFNVSAVVSSYKTRGLVSGLQNSPFRETTT